MASLNVPVQQQMSDRNIWTTAGRLDFFVCVKMCEEAQLFIILRSNDFDWVGTVTDMSLGYFVSFLMRENNRES